MLDKPNAAPPARKKFSDPLFAANGQPRAVVPFVRLKTLWINTGTLCNIECRRCYIDSSPTNDRLAFITRTEAAGLLDEARIMGAAEIGFTGGEPFLNPDMPEMAADALDRGFSVLILTNAMRPVMRPPVRRAVAALAAKHGDRLVLRISLDHYSAGRHDEERGVGAFAIATEGLTALAADGVRIAVAGRSLWGEPEAAARAGYQALFAALGVGLDAADPNTLVLFPEMNAGADTPEITTACWDILGKSPADPMCATARMAIKRKGAAPSIVACTLIVDDTQFELGASLSEAARTVPLNHPHCSRFCVLGGARCSA